MKLALTALIAVTLVTMLFSIDDVFSEKPDAQETPVYLVKSHNPVLKNFLETRHSFDSGFTAKLNEHQIAGLQKARIDVEAIPLYQITKPPGSCTPWPDCKNGGGEDPDTSRKFLSTGL